MESLATEEYFSQVSKTLSEASLPLDFDAVATALSHAIERIEEFKLHYYTLASGLKQESKESQSQWIIPEIWRRIDPVSIENEKRHVLEQYAQYIIELFNNLTRPRKKKCTSIYEINNVSQSQYYYSS